MIKTTNIIISIKYNKRYKNLICIIPDELSYSKDEINNFINKNLSQYYNNYTNYIYISEINDSIKNELKLNSNYKLLNLSKHEFTLLTNDIDSVYYQLAYKNRSINEDKYDYYIKKYYKEYLKEYNKTSKYKIIFTNISVNDNSEDNEELFTYEIKVKFDNVKKEFEITGYTGEHSGLEYNEEIDDYIDDIEDFIDEYILSEIHSHSRLLDKYN